MTLYQVTEWPDWLATTPDYANRFKDLGVLGLFHKAVDWGGKANELGLSHTILADLNIHITRPKED